MKLIPALAFAVIATAALVADGATFQYKISNSPTNAFTQYGGLSGHTIFAGLEGDFAITYETNTSPVLSSFNLRLVNVSENFSIPQLDVSSLEGKPLRDFMSHDLEGSSEFGVSPANTIGFVTPVTATPNGMIVTEPNSSMSFEFGQDGGIVRLYTQLTPLGTIDGPRVTFEPLTATLVPEPATIGLAGGATLALAALRRRKRLA